MRDKVNERVKEVIDNFHERYKELMDEFHKVKGFGLVSTSMSYVLLFSASNPNPTNLRGTIIW